MAIVAKGIQEKVYLSPTTRHQEMALAIEMPDETPANDLIGKCRDQLPLYGMESFADLFTPRQLVALTTFSDLVQEARDKAIVDARTAGMTGDDLRLSEGGTGAVAYGDAVAIYLGFVVDKVADYWSSLCIWHSSRQVIAHTFGRQAIPMVWDYVEANPFSTSSGNWVAMLNWARKALAEMPGSYNRIWCSE